MSWQQSNESSERIKFVGYPALLELIDTELINAC
jgi:hypothetical protein